MEKFGIFIRALTFSIQRPILRAALDIRARWLMTVRRITMLLLLTKNPNQEYQ